MRKTATLTGILQEYGLHSLGWFRLEASDNIAAGKMQEGAVANLFGSTRAMWDIFTESAEFDDGLADPLDRFTKRIVLDAIGISGEQANAIFPFGETVYPFQRFAKRAAGLQSSPLGILMHPRYGLWHALRAAVVFTGGDLVCDPLEKMIHPCDECVAKPCLSACPVTAFSVDGFDVAACRSWIDSTSSSGFDSTGPDCMADGCAARNACPVGQEYRYKPDQIRFHMLAFKK